MSITPKRKGGKARRGKSAPDRPPQMLPNQQHKSNGSPAPSERTPQSWVPGAGEPETHRYFHSQQMRVSNGHTPNGAAIFNGTGRDQSSVAHRIFALMAKLVRRGLGGSDRNIETLQRPGGR